MAANTAARAANGHFATSNLMYINVCKSAEDMHNSPEITSLEIYEPLALPLVNTEEEFKRVINALDSEPIWDTASLVTTSSCLSVNLKRNLLFEPSYSPPPIPLQKTVDPLPDRTNHRKSPSKNQSFQSGHFKKHLLLFRGSRRIQVEKGKLTEALAALPHTLWFLSLEPRKRRRDRSPRT